MTERPIIMTAESVRAILAGTKTQTRRVVRPVSKDEGVIFCEMRDGRWWPHRSADGEHFDDGNGCEVPLASPYGYDDDTLWVRETWAYVPDGEPGPIMYRATDPAWDDEQTGLRWKSPMFMPRGASRITLTVKDVRVERVQDISEADAIAEGLDAVAGGTAKFQYSTLWDKINGKRGYSWESNPWVWAITFKRKA